MELTPDSSTGSTKKGVPKGKPGQAFHQTLKAPGFTGTTIWALVSGILPKGLKFDSSRSISRSTKQTQSQMETVKAVDVKVNTQTQQLGNDAGLNTPYFSVYYVMLVLT